MKTKFQTERSFSESTATRHLHWLFYHGCGTKHLGWDFGRREQLEDGSEKVVKVPGPRVWSVPDDPTERLRWNPVWLHLKGCNRGVCRGQGERFLPFISVDLDRHNGEIQSKDHYEAVLKAGRLLKREFGFLAWLVEVNPKNGSTKFFGLTGRPIPVDQANRLSEQIHQSLVADGIGNREVFPFNSPQVFLPFRQGKTTIIDSGVLGTCQRRRANCHGKRELFTTYSMIAFVEWLGRGRSFDEHTLKRELISACLQLPDQPKAVAKVATIPSTPTKKPIKTPIKTVATPSSLKDEPDSFIRQREALLEFCRRNRRVVSVEEGLTFIKANNLFTGTWEQNRGKRRLRVGQILTFIAKTFDPSLCVGVRHEINFGKFDAWAKQHCQNGWRGTDRKGLDQFGNIIIQRRGRTVADWEFVSLFLSLIEYLVGQDKNSDDSVPSARAKSLWTLLYDQGVLTVPYCPRKWKIARDHLERLGVLKIDHHYHRGQAMKWWVGSQFPGLGLWKQVKAKSLLEAVSLVAFLFNRKEKKRLIHNSLLQRKLHEDDGVSLVWGSGADPPTVKQPTRQLQGGEEAEIGRPRWECYANNGV
jgi:hypothetical protein